MTGHAKTVAGRGGLPRINPWHKTCLGSSVHLDNHTVTTSRTRRWTGFVVALTVTFTVCDAQQFGLSASSTIAPFKLELTFETKRPEQKAPEIIGPMGIVNQAFAIRGPAGSWRSAEGLNSIQYALISPGHSPGPFCLRLNSCESPRAPPPMDPPTFC